MDQVAMIALGANQPSSAGSPGETLRAATAQIAALNGVKLIAKSNIFKTPSFPLGSGPDYVNAALTVNCTLSAQALLTALHGIESHFQRTRETRWSPRTLDLDLLSFGSRVLPNRLTWRQWYELPLSEQTSLAPDTLILPHPRLQDRAFVLVPLAEIAPDWRHPILSKTVQELLAALPPKDVDEITPLPSD